MVVIADLDNVPPVACLGSRIGDLCFFGQEFDSAYCNFFLLPGARCFCRPSHSIFTGFEDGPWLTCQERMNEMERKA